MFFLNLYSARFLIHGRLLETIWTILPIFILFDIAIPSLKILYLIENINVYIYSIKTVGHQWYWSYEYILIKGTLIFDSYILSSIDINLDRFRLLDVDNRIVIPVNCPCRNIITSLDVIHSWTVPRLGVKIDAIPGRLNQITLNGIRRGIFYGQCSEICGMNHSFIPIVVEVTNLKIFNIWVDNIFLKFN